MTAGETVSLRCPTTGAGEMFYKQRNVVSSFSQGRDFYHNSIDAIKQILTEPALLDLLRQVLVRGRNQADIHLYLLSPANPKEGLRLQNPQELDLKALAQLSYLIQEKCAPISQFEETGLGGIRTGKGTLFVPKHFTFQEGLLNGTAVDVDEGTCLSR